MPKPRQIIIIDDNQTSQEQLSRLLQKANYTTKVTSSAKEAWRALHKQAYDLIMLELDLPDMDGLAFLRRIVEYTSSPIVIHSRLHDEEVLVCAFDAGAADYLRKGVTERELLARIRARLRNKAVSSIHLGTLEIDLEHQLATRNGERLRLSNTEWRLLRALIKYAPRIVSYQSLLNYGWGPEYRDEIHYLHVYIGRLRRKIEKNAHEPRLIINQQGIGYRWAPHHLS